MGIATEIDLAPLSASDLVPEYVTNGVPAREINIGGDIKKVDKPLSPDEVKKICFDIDSIAEISHPLIAREIRRAIEQVIDIVQLVKEETASEFEGYTARGNGLFLYLMRAMDFRNDTETALGIAGYDVHGGKALKLNWDKDIANPGWYDLIGAADSYRQMTRYDGEVIVAFEDRVAEPKVEKYEYMKDGNSWVWDTLTFTDRQDKDLYPVSTIKQPLVIPPRSNYRIRVAATATGVDRCAPVAIKIGMAKLFIDHEIPLT